MAAWTALAALSFEGPCWAAGGVTVAPDRLLVAANLHDPVVLRLEVTTLEPSVVVDLRAVGLRMQREAHAIDPTHHFFLIEPDTLTRGRVDGQIEVVDRAGAVLCSVPVTGEVKPVIRVSPARVFLGSLEYGAPSTRVLEKRIKLSAGVSWEVTRVDVSELPPQTQWELQNMGDSGKELHVRFSEDAFKADRPFGAFVQRSIRLATDNPVQPEIVVTFEGMLSRNATKRNFNTYVFRGNERWQGRWSTPNLAAAVVGPVTLLLLGGAVLLGGCRDGPVWLWRPLAVGAGLGTLGGLVLLARTYSRGGWFSLAVGLGLMWWLLPRRRVALASAGFIFVALIVCLPAGMQRAASAGALGEDASIGHRLLVWRGALEIIADHPLRGVGAGRFGEVFQADYQEPWHKGQYTTAINDYLTFAAERGASGVLLAVSSTVCLAVAAMGYLRRHGDYWLVPVVGALLALGTSSIFSSVEFIVEVRFLYAAMTSALAIYCGLRFALERRRRQVAKWVPVGRIWLSSVGAGLATNGLLVAMVVCAALARPAIGFVSPVVSDKDAAASRVEYLPGSFVPTRGTLLILPASSEPLRVLGRQVLRPLAESGWRAVTLNLTAYDQEAAHQVAAAWSGLGEPVVVLAEATRARVAVMAAQLLKQSRPRLVFVDPVFFSALAECDVSNALVITSGAPVVAGERWKAFKRDGRTGLPLILDACDAAQRHRSATSQDGSLTTACSPPGHAKQPVSNVSP